MKRLPVVKGRWFYGYNYFIAHLSRDNELGDNHPFEVNISDGFITL